MRNGLICAAKAAGYNHFINLLNFEASFLDLIRKGRNAELFNQQEPLEKRVASFDGLLYVASYPVLISAFGGAGSMTSVEDAGATH
jgi:hypothetical protein